MQWYEDEVSWMLRQWQQVPPVKQSTVFYGSSSIRMWNSLERDFPELAVVNAGFGGSTLAACAWYFERIVVPLQPRALVVYAGDNDLGDGRSPDEVINALEELLAKVDHHFPGMPFAFLSIKPSPARRHLSNAMRNVNERAKRLMEQRPRHLFIDIFEAMLNEEGIPRQELYVEDGLHMSWQGYALWREIVHPMLVELR